MRSISVPLRDRSMLLSKSSRCARVAASSAMASPSA
jgi:hypothetical protein